MIQWLQSQSLFLLLASTAWIISTALTLGLVEKEVFKFIQFAFALLIIADFVIFGPSAELLLYLQTHWLFSIVIVYFIAMIGFFIEATKVPLASFLILCLDIVSIQVIFQRDLLTIIHLAVFIVLYYKIAVYAVTEHDELKLEFLKNK